MTAFTWIFTTIVVPLLAPNFCLYLLSLAPTGRRVHWLSQLKDGQLCWAVLGFAAAGLYELQTGSQLTGTPREAAFFGLTFLLLPSGMLAGAGAAFPSPEPKAGMNLRDIWSRYHLFAVSVVLTVLAVLLVLAVHFG